MSSSPITADATAAIGDNNDNGNIANFPPRELNVWIARTINNTRDANAKAVALDSFFIINVWF
jgi:hypothetical protein